MRNWFKKKLIKTEKVETLPKFCLIRYSNGGYLWKYGEFELPCDTLKNVFYYAKTTMRVDWNELEFALTQLELNDHQYAEFGNFNHTFLFTKPFFN